MTDSKERRHRQSITILPHDQPCRDCGARGDHFCAGKPSPEGATDSWVATEPTTPPEAEEWRIIKEDPTLKDDPCHFVGCAFEAYGSRFPIINGYRESQRCVNCGRRQEIEFTVGTSAAEQPPPTAPVQADEVVEAIHNHVGDLPIRPLSLPYPYVKKLGAHIQALQQENERLKGEGAQLLEAKLETAREEAYLAGFDAGYWTAPVQEDEVGGKAKASWKANKHYQQIGETE